ncbi:hypothetical protein DY240_04070 [Jiangella rhizosphaerae]|uniref:DUF885 domain-containing protein n=1 Tax=Jiangella rhizosphaerae TaxID=2293569 RepID=A0A418KVD1_9ACTN|nr:hypothetical protein DY240_04070 [Jiangella rhizosphaerae]
MDGWWRDYAVLALRLGRRLEESGAGPGLIYTGPEEWRTAVAAEDPVAAGRLADDAGALRETVPVDGVRAERLRATLTAIEAVARGLDGVTMPFAEYAGRCLGVPVAPEPDDTFAAAHDRLAGALPPGPGSLAERWHAWQRAHQLPDERVAECAEAAVAECVARTRTLAALPEVVEIDVRQEPGPNRGHHAGGGRGTLYLAAGQPFNGADLLYVVAHETFPGHIAESMLTYGDTAAEPERAVRPLLSPAFVVSEGIGLHAQEIAFPGDEAQRWLAHHVLDGAVAGELAAIHEARTALWGAWGNAALLAAEGRPDDEVAGYLTRWALLTEAETAWAVAYLRSPGAGVYVQGYFQGWKLVRGWLDADADGRRARFARLLTEPLFPAELRY